MGIQRTNCHYRVNRIAALLGLAGALVALVVLFLGSHR